MRPSIMLTRMRLLGVAVVLIAVGVVATLVVTDRLKAAETEAAVKAFSQDAAHVTAGELAQWILQKKQDYHLVDLRESWQFDDYHIPTAINIPFAELFRSENLGRFDRQKKVVVYGLGAGRSAQAQMLLGMKGYRAYALEDGIIAWWDEIMTPTSIRSAKPSSSGYQQARQLREYFMTGGQAAATPSAVPSPPATIAPPQPPKPAAKPVARPPAKPSAKSPAKPAGKPAVKPEAKPPAQTEKPPVEDEEKQRLKLGVGCS